MNMEQPNQIPTETSEKSQDILPDQEMSSVEGVDVLQEVEDPQAVSIYNEKNLAVDLETKNIQNNILDTTEKIDSIRADLYQGSEIPEIELPPSIISLKEKLQELKLEKVKSSANYPGDWTNLLMRRTLDPITKEKFINCREAAIPHMKTGEPGPLDKPQSFDSHYQSQIDNYDERVEHIFNATGYGPANEFNKTKNTLGFNNLKTHEQGVVFSDAENSVGQPLNNRQKNIIEAHEKGHGLRDYKNNLDLKEFRGCIDMNLLDELSDKEKQDNPEKIIKSGYLKEADEISERMSQLKNYFGMTASEVFTADHLNYAKAHYLTDTGLDNNMSTFFKIVTPQTEENFLKVINKYPI